MPFVVLDSDEEAQPSAAASTVAQTSGTSEHHPPAASTSATQATSVPAPPIPSAPVPPVISMSVPQVHQPASTSRTVKAPPAAPTSHGMPRAAVLHSYSDIIAPGHSLPISGPSQPPPAAPPVAPMDVDPSSPPHPVSPLMAPFEHISHSSAQNSDSDDQSAVKQVRQKPSTSLKCNNDARSGG
ncbi:hypothetical protein Agabi119p4_2288 [Agaricus bisporus var. burnettii]|uniref:Uncharacterized protein n=1 Tax=Agaricus bisporus var. burnettii TaxID=192524 RepID=A0A8H7KK12_AGABI|nr:hypothetical protein Agabi119p4_2288 [Agaricus bisporus var. burnettii]